METTITPPPPVAGLLPGVDLVRIGTAEAEEFEQVGDRLYKGPRIGSQVVVQPSPGYEFRYDITTDSYRPVRTFPRRTFIITFYASSDDELQIVESIKKTRTVIDFRETTE